jgi:magnesium-transporting ATPase (P-type)
MISIPISVYKTKKEGWSDPTIMNIICIISIIITAIVLLSFVVGGLTKILNPAYHALMALKP